MKLYCNDCIQVMSDMMDGIVDAVITDPPYNVSRENSFTTMSSACRQGLDCFTGSGATGVACKNPGRDFIGIELNPECFRMAEERIEKA